MTEKSARHIARALKWFNDLIILFLLITSLIVVCGVVVHIVNVIHHGSLVVSLIGVSIEGIPVVIFAALFVYCGRLAKRYRIVRYANNDATVMLYALIEKNDDKESVAHLFEGLPPYVSRHEMVPNNIRLSLPETINFNGRDFHGHIFAEFRYRDWEATLRRILGSGISPHDYENDFKVRYSLFLQEYLSIKFLNKSYLYPPAAMKELREVLSDLAPPEKCSEMELVLVQLRFAFVPPPQEWHDEIKLI